MKVILNRTSRDMEKGSEGSGGRIRPQLPFPATGRRSLSRQPERAEGSAAPGAIAQERERAEAQELAERLRISAW